MIRNLKALGLAVVAVLALSAVAASAALAVPQFEVGTGAGNISGTKTSANVFTVAGGRTVTCEVITAKGSETTTSSTLTLTPLFSECHSVLAGVKVPATVTTNDCHILVHLTSLISAGLYLAHGDLTCEGTKDIEIHVYPEGTKPSEHSTKTPLCQYTVKPQTGISKVELKNNATGAKKDIDATLTLSNIAYTRTTGTIPNCGAASSTATLSGTDTLKGEDGSGNPLDLAVIGS